MSKWNMKRLISRLFTRTKVTGKGRGGYTPKGTVRVRRARPDVEVLEDRVCLSTLSGSVWDDVNGNKYRDGGEAGKSGVTVYLDANDNQQLDVGETTTTTDATGNYTFTNLAAGDYIVREITPVNFQQTSPTNSVTDRLFMANVSASLAPNTIAEINPLTGAIIRLLPAPVAGTSSNRGLAFDGEILYFLSDTNDTLYELHPETGAILDQTVLPSGTYDGLASLGGQLFALNSALSDIVVFDPRTDLVVRTIDANGANPGVSFTGGLGALTGPDAIIATTTTQAVMMLNPLTGASMGTINVVSGPDAGVTGIAKDIYVGYSDGNIRVYTAAGTLTRTFNVSPYQVFGLGGASKHDNSHRVTFTTSTQTATGLDFGVQSTLGSLSGSVWEDSDGDKYRDATETGKANVTVYLDANDNRALDAGEQFTTTDANGNYTFTGLLPGNHIVREVAPLNFHQTTPTTSGARLFVANVHTTLAPNTIAEVNPLNGAIIRLLPSPVAGTFSNRGLAFDGEILYFLSDTNDTLYELHPETGAILDQTVLPSGTYDGLTALGGLLYAMNTAAGDILVFDPRSDLVVRTLDANGANPNFTFTGGLGSITGPDAIIATTSIANVLLLDPLTGGTIGTFSGVIGTGIVDAGADAIGQEIYLGYTDGVVRVYNRTGGLIRSFTLAPYQIFGLGAKAAHDDAHRVTLGNAQQVSGLDFGLRSSLGSISGSVWEDSDGDKYRDAGESGKANVTVYLDANDNRALDAGEQFTTTDANGNYTFTGLLPGNHIVREVAPLNFHQTTPTTSGARLFVANVHTTLAPNTIAEVNPLNGAIIRLLPSPVAGTFSNRGLAFDGEILYFLSDTNDTLYELHPETGAILDQTVLPSGTYDGLTALGGLLYAMNTTAGDILVFDPRSDLVVRTLDANGANPNFTFTGGLGSITGPDAIIATTSIANVLLLDPLTGGTIGTFSGVIGTGIVDAGADAIGQEVYLGYTDGGVNVHNRTGGLIRSFTLAPYQIFGLGAKGAHDDAHRVTLGNAQNVSGLDFGLRSSLGSISGSVWEDADGDKYRDTGEVGQANVNVYLDANNNGILDTGERFTTTDANGNYTFTEVAAGNHVVREVAPINFRQTTPSVSGARLFVSHISGTAPNTILEVNPLNGAILRVLAAPVAGTFTTRGIAFDGEILYFVASTGTSNTLFELNPDTGEILDQTTLPSGIYDGLAVLGGQLYVMNSQAGDILVFDPRTDLVVRTIDANGVNPNFSFFGGIGDITGPNAIIATTSLANVLLLDPLTGATIGTMNGPIGIPSADTGVTAIGQEIFLGYSDGVVRVFSRTGTPLRSFTLGGSQVFGLGGAATHDNAHRVTLAAAQQITGLDFGNQSILGSLSGSVWEDANGNKYRDVTEAGKTGVTVYLDANNNGFLDTGEQFTVTDAHGNYSFTGLLPGNHVVRELVPLNYHQTSPHSSPDRLFVTNITSGSVMPNKIVELNPLTGAILRIIPSPLSSNAGLSQQRGLAFDGTTLYFVGTPDGATAGVLYELNPDTGEILDQTTLPQGGYDGLAYLNGLLYANNVNNGDIVVFDPRTDQVVRIIDANVVLGTFLSGGLGAVTGPDALVATTINQQVLFLDPLTGVAKGSFNQPTTSPDPGVDAIGQELFFGYADNRVRVLSRTGTFLREFSLQFSVFGVAGSSSRDDAYRVTLGDAQQVSGLDFGLRSSLGSLSGNLFEDRNGDGYRNPGELAQQGVTVYLDANDNGHLDTGERTATTDVDGNYSFTNVAPGNQVIREVPPADSRQTSPAIRPARLFTVNVNANPDILVELNPVTGAVINTVPLPVTAGSNIHGLDFDGRVVYFLSDTNDTLYELDPDTGAVLDQTLLPAGVYDGLASLNGLVFINERAVRDILAFDPRTDQVVYTLDTGGIHPALAFAGGLGAIEGPDALIATTITAQIVFLDPRTGALLSSFTPSGSVTDEGVTTIGQDIYIGLANNQLRVFSRTGTLLRTFTETFPVFGLGGSEASDTAHRVTLAPAGQLVGLDFGNHLLPVADAGGPYAIVEGQSLTFSAAGSFDPYGAPLSYAWDLDNDGQFDDAVGVTATRSWAQLVALGLDDDGTYTVRVRVDDLPAVIPASPSGGTGANDAPVIASATVTISNVAPVITGLQLDHTTINENGTVTLSGTFTDPGTRDTHEVVIGWGDNSESTTLVLTNGERAFSLTHRYLNDGVYSISAALTDDDDDGDSALEEVTVLNVAPGTIDLMLDAPIINEDGTVTLNGSFVDPGTLDTHTVTIVWGDGSTQSILPLALGARTFSATHRYLDDDADDTYTVTATIADDDEDSDSASIDVTVLNAEPAAINLMFDAPDIHEDGTVTLTGTFTDPGTLDTHTVTIVWGDGSVQTVLPLVPGARGFSATHRYLDDDANDTYTVTATVADDDGGAGNASVDVTVQNAVPSAVGLTLDQTTINEDGTVTLSGTFTDPGTLDTHVVTIAWGDGSIQTVLPLADGSRTFSATHRYLDDDADDTYTITATVADDDGGAGSASVDVTVHNVDPVVTSLSNTAPEIGDAEEGDTVSISASFTDVGTLDTHTATVDWGDGTVTPATVTQNNRTVAASHTYAAGGVYTIKLTLADDDNGLVTRETTAYVTGVGVRDGVIQVVGTDGGDHVHINQQGSGPFMVHADFFPDPENWRTFSANGVEMIQVFLGAGDDDFQISGDVVTPLMVDAGAGDDRVNAGKGPSILIGGTGMDYLVGSSGQDILIGGTTAFDGNASALEGLLREWSNAGHDLRTRVANLFNGTGSPDGANGDDFLTVGPGGTVLDDLQADVLKGSGALDWFFANLGNDQVNMQLDELLNNDLEGLLN